MVLLSSCSLTDKIALKSTASLLKKGSDEILTESNWQHFNLAVPANLKLMEGLWFSDQDNEELLTLLIKGYAAYGFATYETKGMADLLQGKQNSKHLRQAIFHYEKAVSYGLKFLEIKGISQQTFFKVGYGLQIRQDFTAKFSEDDLIAIFYFAQAMGSSINLQRDDISKMGYFTHVKEMLNWTCEQNPKLERGACSLFRAVLLANTPTVMGGSQQKARKHFQKIIKEQPHNYLAHLSYIQYHIVPMLEEEEFSSEMKKLSSKLKKWESYIIGKDRSRAELYEKHRFFNLYNAIAYERYKILKKLKNEIF